VLIPEFLYFYRDNPASLTHNPAFFTRWIANIEATLVTAARRRGFDVSRAERLGPASPTNMDHYILFDSAGNVIKCPYFDYERCSIKQEYK
jgi:hypothetical protein